MLAKPSSPEIPLHRSAAQSAVPDVGKGEDAQILARTGLHLGVTTISRILTENRFQACCRTYL